jgi:hypothetical protein
MMEEEMVADSLVKEVNIEDLAVGDFVLVGANETGGRSHKHYMCTIEKINEGSVDVLFMVCKGKIRVNRSASEYFYSTVIKQTEVYSDTYTFQRVYH